MALCFAGGIGCAPGPQSEPATTTAPGKILQAEGLGKDGSVTINTSGTIVNRYAQLGADALRGDTSITLSSTQAVGLQALLPLTTDDLLMIIQMQGADTDTSNTVTYGAVTDPRSAGRFEFIGVNSVDMASGKVSLYTSCGGLKYDYQAAGNVQVIRVPQYLDLTVTGLGSIIAPNWNGQVGGVVAIVTQNGATINGAIDVTGLGFRGGQRNPIPNNRLGGAGNYYYSMNSQDGGNRGEGIAGYTTQYAVVGAFGRGAGANGGGGGNRIAGGGGGGGNGGDITAWNGEGVMSLAVPGGMQAWPLDPGYDATRTAFAGGGRGGYTVSTMAQNPLTLPPGDPTWGYDFRRDRGGLGGRPVPNDAVTRAFLGGGGGSGDDFASASGSGGSGGGLVYLTAQTISGTGLIRADGQPGVDSQSDDAGGGGGGAGGTLLIGATQLSGLTLQANGGDGGNQLGAMTDASGPGGGGGGGYIATSTGSTVTVLASPGVGGTTASTSLKAFPNNGATDGAPGVTTGMLSGLFGGSPFCSAADLSISLMSTPPQATHQTPPLVIEIAVTDLGPSAAGNVVVNFTAPDGAAIGQITSQGWDCRPNGEMVQCSIDSLSPGAPSTIDITVTPALLLTQLPFTATVSAQATDPVMSNNSASLTVQNVDPEIPRSSGGGFSCSLTSATPPVAGSAGGAAAASAGLLVVAAALARSRRLRQVARQA